MHITNIPFLSYSKGFFFEIFVTFFFVNISFHCNFIFIAIVINTYIDIDIDINLYS